MFHMVSHQTFKPLRKNYPQRIEESYKRYVQKLDYSGIAFPVSVKQ